MSNNMSPEYAKVYATGYGATMVNDVRAAGTIVAVGEVLEKIEALADYLSEPGKGVSAYDDGYIDALIDTAASLREVLGMGDAR